MTFESLLASSIDGLMLGFVYGVAAMGLSLIYGVMRVVNLAHGAVMALGMFALYLMSSQWGINPYLALVVVLGLGLALGVAMYFIAIHRVINAPQLATLLAAFAVNLIIIGLGTVAWSTSPRAVDVSLGTFQAGAVTILGTRVVAVLIASLVTAVLYLFLYRTRTGKSVRAVANNRSAAELMGINTTGILALSFGIGIMLAMTSGALIATLFPFTILSGGQYQLKSFVIVVLGGLGNPTGALLGGIILGLLEGVTTMLPFMSVGWVPVIEYAVFVGILLVRPRGLLGAQI
ncbi:MAG: branched-chain amino acid ABC transporter permease [Chloroflexota bacterium]|nr:branched-chain amino acid ABC transporter permease [Chloroflexota bacterium]